MVGAKGLHSLVNVKESAQVTISILVKGGVSKERKPLGGKWGTEESVRFVG